MDRIKKALEQAERDRGTPVEQSNARAVEAIEPRQRLDPEQSPTAVQDMMSVQYGRTKIVDVSPETLEKNRLVAAIPEHELTDAYRILRTRVLQAMNANQWNALAITSPETGCGKSLTSINLAISLAREVNRTVLLADFDLRNPSVHTYFDYEPELGLSDYLFNDAPLADILFSPSVERLVVLPGRESVHNSSEMLR